MNIFILDESPITAASYLCTVHINKMLLESAQLLSTYCNSFLNNGKQIEGLYKTTHTNHPSNKWLRQNRANYTWLVQHALAIADIYYTHTRKLHSSKGIVLNCLDLIPANVVGEVTDVYLAMPDEIKSKYGYQIEDGNYLAELSKAVQAYREYYSNKKFKRNSIKWYNNQVPYWYKQEVVA